MSDFSNSKFASVDQRKKALKALYTEERMKIKDLESKRIAMDTEMAMIESDRILLNREWLEFRQKEQEFELYRREIQDDLFRKMREYDQKIKSLVG